MANALSNLVKAIAPKKTEFEIAHEVAQRNAALPISEGGLGLPANNTSMDRAKAMGFDTPVYHGTKGDISEFDLKSAGRSTNTKGVFRQSVAATNNPEVAGDYAIHADIRGKKKFIEDWAAREKKIKEVRKKEKDIFTGKISRDEYNQMLARAYDTSKFEFNADTPGMDGFWYGSQIAKTDANILPLLIKRGVDVYPEKWNQTVIKQGIKGISDPVTFHNVPDVIEGLRSIDNLHNTTIIQNPSHIRSRFAAFDPMQRNSANILAGGALGAIGLGAMIPEGEAQASEMPANALSAAANGQVSRPIVRAPMTREELLNAEYSHNPMQPEYKPKNIYEMLAMAAERRRQLETALGVAQGKLSADISYGEDALEPPTVGPISLDPTDYIGPGAFKALVGGLKGAALKGAAIKGGVIKGAGLKSIPAIVGGVSLQDQGQRMAKLIREAQAQIDAENAARNALKYKIQDNRVRNALVGIGAGGAGVAGGYYGADYLAGGR